MELDLIKLQLYIPVHDRRNSKNIFNPLNAELNLICHLLALLGGATIVVVSRLRVNMAALDECQQHNTS